MPRLGASKESLVGIKPMPEGIMQIQLRGFKPTYSKDKKSVNYNPQLHVVNHPEYNDRQILEWMNSQAGWVQNDFCHCFGLPMVEDGDMVYMPGSFLPETETDPEKWSYAGPLLGQVGTVEIALVDNTKGVMVNRIRRYVCKVPGCTTKHSDNLAK